MSELRLLKEKREKLSVSHAHESLLITKMQPPPLASLISRPRLLARLDVPTALTLITAPAGCGKTALLYDCLWQHPSTTTWLTLDESDNDIRQLLTYMAAALGIDVNDPSPEAILITVINGIVHEGQKRALILDNYHTINNPEAHQVIAYLLDHLPQGLRLIIAGRTMPPLPLARLRLHGQLNHIHSPEIAFSQQEASEYLHSQIPDSIDDASLAYVEGWAAGLQFLALAFQDSTNPNEQTERVQQYIREFVAQEVLGMLPPGIQNFLLHTSLLENLTPALCNMLTGQQDGYATLQSLLAEGLFVRRDGGETYRYAPFFREALCEQLALTSPAKMNELTARIDSLKTAGEEINDPALVVDSPLSQREHEVLSMLADGLSSPEIAHRMIIAVSTVKTHIKHIYRKLEVDNRYQAVKRARELNLVQIEWEERMRRMIR